MGMELLIALLVSGGTVLMLIGVVSYAGEARGRQQLLAKIKQAGVARKEPEIDEGDGDRPAGAELKRRFLGILHSLGEKAKPTKQEDISHMQKTFLQAGIRGRNAVVLFFGAKAMCAIALPVLFALSKLLILRPMTPLYVMFVTVALALVGFYLPDVWLRIRTSSRKDQITRAFPDALDLLVVCVEAGMGLDAAISRVAEEMSLSSKVLSDELRLLNLEMRAGKSRRDALQNLAVRTGLDDVSNLVTLLIQTDKFGTSIAQALRVHSDSMRTARYQRAEEMATKLPVKLLFPLIFFIFPSLFVVIMGPALIRAFRIWSGH